MFGNALAAHTITSINAFTPARQGSVSAQQFTPTQPPGTEGLTTVMGWILWGATALLFVVDASSPFTRGELEFLQQVGERVETVLFALAKTDQHRGWRQVLAEDRKLLAAALHMA